MGVISKSDAKLGIFVSVSEESLHIPQSDDDCSEASTSHIGPARRPVPRRVAIPTFQDNARGRFGKKRLRRLENVNQLMTLVEEEEFNEVTITDFVPTTQQGFIHILNDEAAFEIWNNFVNSSEEAQFQILHTNDVRPKYASTPNTSRQLSGEEAFMNIKSGLRNKLKKISVPQGMVDYLEQSLVDFFVQTPTDTYISESTSSFERMLLHAISQYHRLISRSINTEPEKVRLVQVDNPCHEFHLPTVLFGKFLMLKRQRSDPTP